MARVINSSRLLRGCVSKTGRESSSNVPEGLFPKPFIDCVEGGTLNTNSTKRVVVHGYHFDPDSEVVIKGEGVKLERATFVNPSQIELTISTGSVEGKVDLLIKNRGVDSGETGYDRIVVKENNWFDLRTAKVEGLGLKMTEGIIVNQDEKRGLFATGTGHKWRRGIVFPSLQWKRSEKREFAFVFTTIRTASFMFGIGSAAIDVNDFGGRSYYAGEFLLRHTASAIAYAYGGGEKTNWKQHIGKKTAIKPHRFYKVVFHQSGEKGSHITLYKVAEHDFNRNVEMLYSFASDCPAQSENLLPFWAAPNTKRVFIAGLSCR